MEYGYYHPTVGYWQTLSPPSEDLLNEYPEGTKNVPVKPGPGYEYNGSTWVAPSQAWLDDQEAAKVRQLRKRIMRTKVDPVVTNPLRWADLDTLQQDELKAYRQDLLDLTDQPGFPFEITWPTKPSWL